MRYVEFGANFSGGKRSLWSSNSYWEKCMLMLTNARRKTVGVTYFSRRHLSSSIMNRRGYGVSVCEVAHNLTGHGPG